MRYRIPVYKAEADIGLAEAIQANASIAYEVPLEPLAPDAVLHEYLHRAAATDQRVADDQFDLYYLKDILVSTGWNLNHDVFDRVETFAARHTPEDKPFNFEHRPLDIIGHITASRVVDSDMKEVDDNIAVDDLPSKFHILSGSVLYMALADEERKSLMQQTVAEIEKGEWYVSMECYFRGFDYGVIAPDGSQRIVPRTEATAFLTKYMRQYRPADAEVVKNPYYGSGTYVDESTGDTYKLGRVMRNITFSGKGLVRRPGNPESVILNNVATFMPTISDSGYLPQGNKTGSTPQEENTQMAEANINDQALADANREIEALRAEVASLKSKTTDETIAALRKDVADRDAVIAEKGQEISSLSAQLEAVKESSKAVEARATQAETDLASAREELGAVKAAETKRSRLSLLRDKGAEAAVADKLVEKLSALDDTAFADTVETIAAQWKPKGDQTVAAINRAKPEPEPALATLSEDDRETSHATIVGYFGESLKHARAGRPSAYATETQE